MIKLLILLTIFILFFNISSTEKVNVFKISELISPDEVENIIKSDVYNEPIEIKITDNNIANLINYQMFHGNSLKINNIQLKEDKLYGFTKVREYECQEKPFYHNEEKNQEFYLDACRTYVHTCDDYNTKISTDSIDVIDSKYLFSDACKVAMKLMESMESEESDKSNTNFNEKLDKRNKCLSFENKEFLKNYMKDALINQFPSALSYVTSPVSTSIEKLFEFLVSNAIDSKKEGYCSAAETIFSWFYDSCCPVYNTGTGGTGNYNSNHCNTDFY